MSDRQEFYAPTVEEAVARASAALGAPRDQLDFEVLDRGSSGFLGIGAREARILVEHPSSEFAAPTLAEDDRLRESSYQEGVSPGEEPPEAVEVAEDPDPSTAEAADELIVAVDEFMTSLINAMGFDATVDVYDSGDAITVDVATQETGLFIGQKGETIDAVQYLLNVAIYKDRTFVKRLVVDSEGYRQRRVEAIQGMAHRTARRALREKRPVALPPMSPAERRVVHLFLQENPSVTTFSDGEEEDRRVLVSPV